MLVGAALEASNYAFPPFCLFALGGGQNEHQINTLKSAAHRSFQTFSRFPLLNREKLRIFAGEKKRMIMSTQQVTQKIADYFKTQPVNRAWLFGSFARGEETPDSDIDILVEYDEDARISLLTISHMMGELERSTGRRIDLIEEGCLLPFAVESANRDKRLIYERRG